MLYHPPVVIYQPMLRLLHQIITYQVYVDFARPGSPISQAPHTCWVGFSRCPDAWGINGCGSGNGEACSSSSKDHTPGERSCAPFSLSSSRWTSEENWAFWIISVLSSSSQLDERSFPHAAVCVVETQVIGSASGEIRAKITSSLGGGPNGDQNVSIVSTSL